MKKYQKPVLDTVKYEVEEILTVSGLNVGGDEEGFDPVGGDVIDISQSWK